MFYDDERMWPFIKSGILCPPWMKKNEGRGQGSAGFGWGLGLQYTLIVIEFEKVLNEGLNKIVKDAEEELRNLRFWSADDIKKGHFLQSVIIALPAIVRIAKRYGDLATELAKERERIQNGRKNWKPLPSPVTGCPVSRPGHSAKPCSLSGSSGS